MDNILELIYDTRKTITAGNLGKFKEIINKYGLSYCPMWDNGHHLLSFACEKDKYDIVAFLLSKNVQVNSDRNSISPLQLAVLKNNVELVKLLLKHGAKAYTNNEKAPIEIAIENKNIEIAKLLFAHKAVNRVIHESSNTSDNLALHSAVISREYSMIKLLLDNGFNANVTNLEKITPIHLAIMDCNNLNIIKLLLDYGADPNAQIIENCPLFPAFLECLCVSDRLRPDENDDQIEASKICMLHLKMLNLFLDYNADINIVDQARCKTPLYFVYYSLPLQALYNPMYEEFKLKRDEVVIKQIIKLRESNSYVSVESFQLLDSMSSPRILNYQKKCENELSQMVNEKIPNTTISLFNFVTKNDDFLASYVNNVNTKRFIFSDDIKNRFPIYASSLKASFSRGIRRKTLLEESMKVFENNWLYASNLLSNCLQYIFMYLNNNDLHEFIWKFKQENQ